MVDCFYLDIPSLTNESISIKGEDLFSGLKEQTCSSMIDGLIMIEMLILLIDSFVKEASL